MANEQEIQKIREELKALEKRLDEKIDRIYDVVITEKQSNIDRKDEIYELEKRLMRLENKDFEKQFKIIELETRIMKLEQEKTGG